MYFFNLMKLFLARKINFQTVKWAMKERPIAVCGRGGSYEVDPMGL